MDKLIRKYDGQTFQTAFRAYIMEMGIQVSNWEGLFTQMTERNCGIGSELLAQAEAFFSRQGIHKMILTSDTAEGFYRKHGYRRDEGIVAKNRAPVFVKG